MTLIPVRELKSSWALTGPIHNINIIYVVYMGPVRAHPSLLISHKKGRAGQPGQHILTDVLAGLTGVSLFIYEIYKERDRHLQCHKRSLWH